MFKRDLTLDRNWQSLLLEIERMLGEKPKDINGVLFLIGVQELGRGHQLFTKEQKQDLMHIAICKVLSYTGCYVLEGLDKEGWPHWKLVKKMPRFDLLDQEKLLKSQVLEYFEREFSWVPPHESSI